MTQPPIQIASTKGPYVTLVVMFCSLLLISNIAATKLILGFGLPLDGGVFLFPLVYVLGDVITEVYGWKAARRAILLGFAMSLLATANFWLVQVSPAHPEWHFQESYEHIIGFVPNIVFGSMAGFVCGQLTNSQVLIRLKRRFPNGMLWQRLIGSSLIGQIVDTTVFSVIAFSQVFSDAELFKYALVGIGLKLLVEIAVIPVTYQVVRRVQRAEARLLAECGRDAAVQS